MTNKTLVKSLLPFLVAASSLPAEAATLPTSAPALFSSPAEAKKAEEYVYAFALKLIAEKKLAPAAAILQELIDAGSDLPSSDEFIRLLNQLDDHTSIIRYYEKNRERSFAGETYAYIGIAYMEQKDAANARICFDKAAAAASSARRSAQTDQGKGDRQKAQPLLTTPGQSQPSPAIPADGFSTSAPGSASTTTTGSSAVSSPYDLPLTTYHSLLDDLRQVGQNQPAADRKIKIGAELRYHYAAHSGDSLFNRFDRDSSGLRLYLGANTALDHNWHAYVMAEGRKNILRYNSQFDLTRYYVTGKLGETQITAGKFGYLMADGNIYDSSFSGIRADFGKAVKYTAALGYTNDVRLDERGTYFIKLDDSYIGIPVAADYAKNNGLTAIATARYKDYDYELEAGIYTQVFSEKITLGVPGVPELTLHGSMDRGRQTITTVSGKYHFSNFSLGARYLRSNLAAGLRLPQFDYQLLTSKNGYVLSMDYGDLKTWRPHTYSLFARYYNQPRFTYFDHGMNGLGNRMIGFKGWGVGGAYTLRENLILGIDYYSLTDLLTTEKANTIFTYISHYF